MNIARFDADRVSALVWAWSPPASWNEGAELLSLSFKVDTDATVANRFVEMLVGTTLQNRTAQGLCYTFTASQSVICQFAKGCSTLQDGTAGSIKTLAIGAMGVYILQGERLLLNLEGVGADALSNVQVLVGEVARS